MLGKIKLIWPYFQKNYLCHLMRKLKRYIKWSIRRISDRVSGKYFRFARKQKSIQEMPHFKELKQEIKVTEHFENKIFNIKLAADRINGLRLNPGEIFSFWHIVGNPDKDFKTGRAILNGVLSEETGGGLCQASSIVFHLSLMAGLRVLERHNHSVDIYTEEARFTPLGTDATVVFGYKDLRVENSFDFPFYFLMNVSDDNRLTFSMHTPIELPIEDLKYERTPMDGHVMLKIYGDKDKLLSESLYKIPIV